MKMADKDSGESLNGTLFGRFMRHLQGKYVFGGDMAPGRVEWLPGPCRPGLCGEEAACYPGLQGTHKCVCPSDFSTPTIDNRCPTRKTVAPTPKTIVNISVQGNTTTPPGSGFSPFDINDNSDNGFDLESHIQVYWIGIVLVLVFFLGLLMMSKWKRENERIRHNNIRRQRETGRVRFNVGTRRLLNFVTNPAYMSSRRPAVPNLSRRNLEFDNEIGQGHFGKVFRGYLRRRNGDYEAVAIKVLKLMGPTEEQEFWQEVEIMSNFDHENILKLLGIVERGIMKRPWMVFELMEFGDLAHVLRRNSKEMWSPIPGMDPLSKEDLLYISLQIAAGMRYLSSRKFVHNDLACRNCLVGRGVSIKIADFGMSRDIYLHDYYRIGRARPVPLRWMAPESLKYRRTSTESDVWSYGVVLWEIYTLGKQPYFGFANHEVLKLLEKNCELQRPRACPLLMYCIMRSCWELDPSRRLSFDDIHEILSRAYEEKQPEALESYNDTTTVLLPRPPRSIITSVIPEEPSESPIRFMTQSPEPVIPVPRPTSPGSPNTPEKYIVTVECHKAPETQDDSISVVQRHEAPESIPLRRHEYANELNGLESSNRKRPPRNSSSMRNVSFDSIDVISTSVSEIPCSSRNTSRFMARYPRPHTMSFSSARRPTPPASIEIAPFGHSNSASAARAPPKSPPASENTVTSSDAPSASQNGEMVDADNYLVPRNVEKAEYLKICEE